MGYSIQSRFHIFGLTVSSSGCVQKHILYNLPIMHKSLLNKYVFNLMHTCTLHTTPQYTSITAAFSGMNQPTCRRTEVDMHITHAHTDVHKEHQIDQ